MCVCLWTLTDEATQPVDVSAYLGNVYHSPPVQMVTGPGPGPGPRAVISAPTRCHSAMYLNGHTHIHIHTAGDVKCNVVGMKSFVTQR